MLQILGLTIASTPPGGVHIPHLHRGKSLKLQNFGINLGQQRQPLYAVFGLSRILREERFSLASPVGIFRDK